MGDANGDDEKAAGGGDGKRSEIRRNINKFKNMFYAPIPFVLPSFSSKVHTHTFLVLHLQPAYTTRNRNFYSNIRSLADEDEEILLSFMFSQVETDG